MDVWNWQSNLRRGIAILQDKRRYAVDYFAYIKKAYPNQWEEPPASYHVAGTEVSLPYLDVSTIILYNGANMLKDSKTGITYLYCFEFNASAASGKRWTFKPNPINPNYLQEVVREM